MKSITDICRIAKCARSTYYEAFGKPGFVELYKQESANLVQQSVAPVINAFITAALRGSFQHGKVLLEMADMYSDKLEITGQMNVNNPFDGLTTEELKKLIQDDD